MSSSNFKLKRIAAESRVFLETARLSVTARQHGLLRRDLYWLRSSCLPVCLSVCLSLTRWHYVKTTKARITKSSPTVSPRTLVLAIKSSSRNTKGFTPSEGVKWQWSEKNSQFSANKSPYLRNCMCKIRPKLLLKTNRKSHTPFGLVSKSTISDDLERLICTLMQKRCVFGSPPQKKLNEEW